MDDRQKIGHRPSDGNADVVTGFMILGVSIIFAAVISAGIYIGYVEYKAYKIERAAVEAAEALNRQMAAEAAKQQARIRAERQAQAEKARVKRIAEEEERKFKAQSSHNCQFWKTQHGKNPSEKTAAALKKYCPFG